VRQRPQSSTVHPGTTNLTDAISSIVELGQGPLYLPQRGLDLTLERHAHSLLKGIGAVVGDVIAVANTLVLDSLKPP
jgi:hypothetical protein